MEVGFITGTDYSRGQVKRARKPNGLTPRNQQHSTRYRGAALRFKRFALVLNISNPDAKQGHLYVPMVDCIAGEPTICYNLMGKFARAVDGWRPDMTASVVKQGLIRITTTRPTGGNNDQVGTDPTDC